MGKDIRSPVFDYDVFLTNKLIRKWLMRVYQETILVLVNWTSGTSIPLASDFEIQA